MFDRIMGDLRKGNHFWLGNAMVSTAYPLMLSSIR
jgi:hypothetical protein